MSTRTAANVAALVGRRRGGYCYEHALRFGAALEQLGFEVTRRVARVQPHKAGPRTHALLKVGVDGEEFLALAPNVPVRAEVVPFPLREANEALRRLRAGELRGAAVLVMGQ